MKNLRNILILTLLAVCWSCSSFDESPLRNRVDSYKERIEALKQKAQQLNGQISDLGYLTNGNVITSVSKDSEGKYVVTYKDSADKEHTVVLATMGDIIDVPIVGVALDEGVYYWTKFVDGESSWLLDGEGQMIPVSGYTPTISVDAEGYWTVDGERLLDGAGQPIEANDDASAVFAAAKLDAEGNFCLTLGDGTTLTLPVFNSLNLKLSGTPQTIVTENAMDNGITFNYDLTGESKDKAVIALAKVEGVNAVLDRDARTITVTFESSFSGGKVFVMAYDLEKNVIVRPLFFSVASSDVISIGTAQQLVDFATAVNAGGPEASASVVLTADIDLASIANWTPIGNGLYTTAYLTTGAAFEGTFNGQGHSVKNMKIAVPADAVSGTTAGLFGVVKGGTVKNLTIGTGSAITSTAANMTAVGAVTGYAFEATIDKCKNYASLSIGGGTNNIRQFVGGIVGGAYAKDNTLYIKECENYGTLSSTNTINTAAGATGLSIGGILGIYDTDATNKITSYLTDCVNEGVMTIQATRAAGIVASVNKHLRITDCENKANITNTDTKSATSRSAGIVAAFSVETHVKDCVNRGNITFAVAGNYTGYVGGIAVQPNDNAGSVDGCTNYGTILSDVINSTNASLRCIGIIVGNNNNRTIEIKNCKVGGKIGAYSDGEAGATEITAANFANYIYFTATTAPTLSNNTFAGEDTPPGAGISSVEDLLAFRDAVNAGTSLAEWTNADGVVELLKDLDMSSVQSWTPIGVATYTLVSNKLVLTGKPFTGIFDGKGHSLKNFKLSYTGSTAGATYGLFGALESATVRNLTIGAASGDTSSLTVSVSGAVTTETGVIAGVCRQSTVSDCVNYAPMTYNGSTTGRVTMGMVGFAFAEAKASTLENLTNYGNLDINTNGNSQNGGNNAIQCAGIVGFTSNDQSYTVCVNVDYCDNYGNMVSTSARTAGVVCAANRYTRINSCVNHGNQTNSVGDTGRLGGVTCITGAGSSMQDCINNGNLISTSAAGARIGGLMCMANDASNTIIGCANYGEVISNSAYRGVFVGYNSLASTWVNCTAGGKLGAYNGGTYAYDSYSDDLKELYLGNGVATMNKSNIIYAIDGQAGGGDSIDPTLRILFIGNSFTMDAVTHIPAMLGAADIKSVKMAHMYYGGRTIPEYNTGYASTNDYIYYMCNTGMTIWAQLRGYTIKQVVASESWDIVCLQEHTGKSNAWNWTTAEKDAIEGLITKIKADQGTNVPKFVYIMSQAYANPALFLSSDLETYTQKTVLLNNFTSQDQMYATIVTQGQKVLAETSVEKILATGTVLQNLRRSSLNNAVDLTRDGYHMDYGLSRYAASCLIFESLISPYFENYSLDGNSFRYATSNTTIGSYSTPVTDANKPKALAAARAAMTTPFAVTAIE